MFFLQSLIWILESCIYLVTYLDYDAQICKGSRIGEGHKNKVGRNIWIQVAMVVSIGQQ